MRAGWLLTEESEGKNAASTTCFGCLPESTYPRARLFSPRLNLTLTHSCSHSAAPMRLAAPGSAPRAARGVHSPTHALARPPPPSPDFDRRRREYLALRDCASSPTGLPSRWRRNSAQPPPLPPQPAADVRRAAEFDLDSALVALPALVIFVPTLVSHPIIGAVAAVSLALLPGAGSAAAALAREAATLSRAPPPDDGTRRLTAPRRSTEVVDWRRRDLALPPRGPRGALPPPPGARGGRRWPPPPAARPWVPAHDECVILWEGEPACDADARAVAALRASAATAAPVVVGGRAVFRG